MPATVRHNRSRVYHIGMATQVQALTDDVVTDLKTTLSLANGTAYSIEVASGRGVVLYEAASAPASTDQIGSVLRAGDLGKRYLPIAAESLYVWALDGTATIIVNLAA